MLPYDQPIPTYTHVGKTRALSVVTVTRPADTTAYAVGDVYGSQLDARVEIPNVGEVGQVVRIAFPAIQHRPTATAALTLNPFLFATAPSAISDNAAFALTDADIAAMPFYMAGQTASAGMARFNAVGNFQFQQNNFTTSLASVADPDGRRACTNAFPAYTVKLTGTSVWLYLVLNAAYTPASGEIITIRPQVEVLSNE